jgi:iron-sulfur cluster assembly accessory protein
MIEISLSESALLRVKEIVSKPENNSKFLRIAVDSGGCSGFQYIFKLDDQKQEDDLVVYVENSQPLVICDESSSQFLIGSQIDFVKELGSQYFKVNNPNAKANCGCGQSFTV